MKQPALGLVATAIVIAIALGYISLFDFNAFTGWASYVVMCIIPFEIVAGVHWGANPPFAAKMSQPLKGIVLMLVCIASAAILGPAYWQSAGGGSPIALPNLILCIIPSVVVMFWLCIMFGGWPFTLLSKNPVVSGILLWVGALAINYGLFRVFFNFDFLKGAPIYVEALNPHGMFDANAASVFYVTAIAFLFFFLHFDLWPFTTSPSIMKQPTLGIVWTVVALILGYGTYYLGTTVAGYDPLAFLIRGPVPFIFGTIVVLNMLHNSLFAKLQQPVKGIVNNIAAMAIGTGLAWFYGYMAPIVTGSIKEGPPTSDYERWLASALLGITFPFLVAYAEFFKMWPLMGQPKPEAKAGRAAA